MAMGLADVAPPEALLDAALAMVRPKQESEQYLKDRDCWEAPMGLSETELGFLGRDGQRLTSKARPRATTRRHWPRWR